MEITQLQLLPPPTQFTPTEETILRQLLAEPVMIKYLNIVLWGLITDNANIPLPVISADLQEHALKQSYVKGGISVVHMLQSVNIGSQQT